MSRYSLIEKKGTGTLALGFNSVGHIKGRLFVPTISFKLLTFSGDPLIRPAIGIMQISGFAIFIALWHYTISTKDVESSTNKLAFAASGPNVPEQHISLNGQQNFQAAQQIFYYFGDKANLMNRESSGERNGSLPNGYFITPEIGAHKYHLDKKTWNEARKACIREGAHLAVMKSSKEEEILQNWRKSSGEPYAHLGVHDQFAEGDWVSVLDESSDRIGYMHWSAELPNNPDNLGGNQHCGALRSGGMDDVVCSENFPYFCKISFDYR